ncbi:hypothetical protein UPYG_G00321650 [Umbra pygmaea]|uniref:C2H2-type domain-containing protein n=1 Tax=Umbra pygmaea TaxID=75934 RepID=A0ABD0W0L3_UMBPY
MYLNFTLRINMDLEHSEVLPANNITVLEDEDKNWQKRLRLRKTVVNPPTMQSEDKHGPKKIAEDKEKSSEYLNKTPLNTQQSQHVTKVSGNTLWLGCSNCKGSREFSPDDLLRHFQENHPGHQPMFPCDMCNFITDEFSRFQVHQLGHRDSLVSCSICNDNVQRTLLQLTTHFKLHHSVKGHYSCEKCKLSTKDVGAFLEHMYLHTTVPDTGNKANHSNFADQDCQKHRMAKTSTLPFICQFCDFKANRKDIITKHMDTVHGEQSNKNMPKIKAVDSIIVDHSTTIRRPPVTRRTARERNWMSHSCLSLPGKAFLDKYCRLSNPESALEETQQFLEKSVAAETDEQTWSEALKTVLSNVSQPITLFSNSANCMTSNPGYSNTGKDLAFHMLKNKISVPPNGTIEPIGLKVMEGKQDLLLKVTPSAYQETSDTTKMSICVNEQESKTFACQTCSGDSFLPQNDAATISTINNFEKYDKTYSNRENQEIQFGQEHREHQRHFTKFKDMNHCENVSDSIKFQNLMEKTENEQKAFPECLRSSRSIADKKRGRKKWAGSKTVDKTSPALKLLLKKNPVKEMHWMSQGNSPLLGAGFLNDLHKLEHPQKTLKETQQFLKRALSAENPEKPVRCEEPIKCRRTDLKHNSKADAGSSKSEGALIPNSGHFTLEGNDLSSVIAENNISDPPNYTTEAMSFKMVDGKTHLVLKVTPTAFRGNSDKTEESVGSINSKDDNAESETRTKSQNSLGIGEKTKPNSIFHPSARKISSLDYSENVVLSNTNVSSENTGGMKVVDSLVLNGQTSLRAGLPNESNVEATGNPLGQMIQEIVLEDVNCCQPYPDGVGTTSTQVIMMSSLATHLTSPQGVKMLSGMWTRHSDVFPPDLSQNPTLRNAREQGFCRTSLSPLQNELTVRAKRQSKPSTGDSTGPLSETDKSSSQGVLEEAVTHHWEPGPRHVERTLKLFPLSPTQLITRPRGEHPVVVLNHPDTDIPEVTNIMKSVHRYKEEVQKVVLSQKTLKALGAMGGETFRATISENSQTSHQSVWPENRVKERFLLRMKLRKMSRKKYTVVDAISSHDTEPRLRFRCWFCGRAFSDQEVWIRHGQRHVLDSTSECDKS